MNKNTGGEFGGFALGIVIGGLIGAIAISYLCKSVWEEAVVNRGFAYYHPKTAQFTWKTNMIEKVEFNK